MFMSGSLYPSETEQAQRQARRSRWLGIIYVSTAALLWSTAGIWVRYLTLDIWTIQCGRAFFGAVSLMLYIAIINRNNVIAPFATIPLAGFVIVPINTIGMMAYMQALNWTTVANVMIVYTTLPFVVALLGWLWIRERVAMRTMFASAIALSGVTFMVGGSFQAGNVKGDLASFVMVLSFAALVILARRHPNMSMAAHSVLSGVLCAVVTFPLADFSQVTGRDLVLLAILGSITIGVANVLYMRGVARIPAAEAGLIGLLDTIVAPLWVFMMFNERPEQGALVGGAIVLAAVIYQIIGEGKKDRAL
jgi:drug/metabolite transporter (DMT)-like permease